MKKVLDYEIREDRLDNGSAVFDVYEQYDGDSEWLEEFSSRADAEAFVEKLKRRGMMSFDELTEEQKLQVKQNYLVRLADMGMFVKTMKKWHQEEYGSGEPVERGPSIFELSNADRLVPDDVISQEGVKYVSGDFGCEDGSKEKNGIETVVVEGVPLWAVDYFVNAETSGLDEEDLKIVTEYEKKLLEQGLRLMCPIDGTENAFDSYPAFGLACDTVDFYAEVIH
jgi:hypothetical protein